MKFFALLPLATMALAQADAPLPDSQVLKQRLLQNLKKSETELEKYSCLVRTEEDQLNADGSFKKRRTREQERFFVNGIQIDHVLSRDGKPLSAAEAKKEQDRVNYETKKYSNLKEVQKRQAEEEKQVNMFLRALRFTNERREIRDGRSTIVFDLTGDPSYHAKSLEERFAVAMTGSVWVDEETGNVGEVRAHTARDVKIGGGLLATVHKGFRVMLIQQPQPDGVWLAKVVEGTGDARAALFLHPRFRFREDIENCRLFTVNTQQSIQAPPPAPKP